MKKNTRILGFSLFLEGISAWLFHVRFYNILFAFEDI